MTNKSVFCNTPWYEIHIYWDGSLGICCQEDHKLYNNQSYNIATTTIEQWFNSGPVRQFRLALLGDRKHSACTRCYVEEEHGGTSRRLRSNQKSVIFTRQAFDESFAQSPGRTHFDHSAKNLGHALTQPIDLHIDLGNFCNLACKMCNAQASSRIASQEVAWGQKASRQYLGTDWTKNTSVWNSFLDQVLIIPGLQNIHFMGGETLLTDRLEQLVDRFIAAGRFDVCFSFVTNGTVYRPELIEKLTQFQRVGIEISIECLTPHNSYQRQGTDTQQVLDNIDQYLALTNGSSVTVALRPAPSALTVGYLHTLLRYALSRQLVVKSTFCYDPKFLDPRVLPHSVKQQYLEHYQRLLSELPKSDVADNNASDPTQVQYIVRDQATMIVNCLMAPQPEHADQLLGELVQHCRRWDNIYGYNAVELYPELAEVFQRYGY